MTTLERKAALRAAVDRYNARYPDRVKATRKASRDRMKQVNPAGYRLYRRKMDLKRKGLTPEEFERLRNSQHNKCAICQNEFGSRKDCVPHIDHDHRCCPQNKSCGKCIRGLLCSHCNMGLGRFRDSIESLLCAISYLTRYK